MMEAGEWGRGVRAKGVKGFGRKTAYQSRHYHHSLQNKKKKKNCAFA